MSMTLPSYTSGTSEVPLLGMTIGAMLDRTAEKYPDTEALVALHQDIRWTYKAVSYTHLTLPTNREV